MPEDSKLKKIAAARKKLKAYQAKEKTTETSKATGSEEPQETEPEIFTPQTYFEETKAPIINNGAQMMPLSKTIVSFSDKQSAPSSNGQGLPQEPLNSLNPFTTSDTAHTSTIELLINEKASLCNELALLKADSKEKMMAAEEANVRLQNSTQRIEKLEKDLFGLQSQNSQLQAQINHYSTISGQTANEAEKFKHETVELHEYVEELKQALQAQMGKVKALDDQLKDKECEVELNKIRINQISDVASVETDTKVEVLTQTQFVHEQQIRDLQSMVQQLEMEREQASQQYQSYVQHLNKEITAFSEKNLKLNDENMTLVNREQSLIGHVGDLEKQLQQLIARQQMNAFAKESQEVALRIAENEAGDGLKLLQTEHSALLEKHQQLETQIETMQKELNEKNSFVQELEEKLENFTSIQSDSTKLLAKVESDGVAASRAVAQNEELKKQLDEVQMKLIQVTNDKVELMNQLDSEKYANREIRTNYESMEKEIATINEKLHFKDEEMIRLSKENNDLNNRITAALQSERTVGANSEISVNGAHNETHSHSHSCDHSHDSNIEETTSLKHDHDHHHGNDSEHGHDHEHDHDYSHHGHNNQHELATAVEQTTGGLPQSEAMQKLEGRFKSLMNDIADLTDEKQRLEHLVLQLQSETETIGEYIALYQSQRRVLKQREIEKNTQLHKLKSEREELRDKISLLNQLVTNLSQQCEQTGITSNNNITETLSSLQLTSSNSSIETQVDGDKLINNLSSKEPLDSNQIIFAIKNIVSDIKDREKTEIDLNFVPTLDHCSCCSGKFETI